jgi:zinc protease
MSSVANAESVEPRVLIETSRALPLVSFAIGTRASALHDPLELDGLTRITARMMRRTGGGRDPQAIDTLIDSLGASVSADVSHSVTLFQGTVIRRSLDAFLDLVSDILAKPGLAEDELQRLVRETSAELVETLDDDRGLARRWFRKRLFGDHGYSRPLSGTSSSLANIRREHVVACAERLTARDGLVFAFSGDIEQSAAHDYTAKLLAALPTGPALGDSLSDPSVPNGRRLVLVDKPDRTQTQILIGGLGTHPADPDHTALSIGNTIFGGTFTARLTQEVRSKRGWSYGAYSSLPIDRRRQGFSLWTFPKAEDAAPCIALELELLKTLREHGVTKKELSWAKRYLTRSHAFAVDTASKRIGLALDEQLYDLPPRYHSDYLARIAAVTLDEVNEAIRKRINDRDLLIVVVGTAADLREKIEAAIPELGSTEVVRFDTEV